MIWMWMVACQTDPLAGLGLEPAPVEQPADVVAAPTEPAAPPTEEAAPPTEPPADGATPAPADEVAEAPRPPPADFNPISIPQGPREGGGVRWEGVSSKWDGIKPSRRQEVGVEDPNEP